MLAKVQESVYQDKEHSHNLRLAQLKSTTYQRRYSEPQPQTHVHIHSAVQPQQVIPININQNQVSVVISKVRH